MRLIFSVIQTGKESKRVNGFYQPDTHEIYLHNLNFKSDNMLIYTAVHEYTHHLCTIEKQENDPKTKLEREKSRLEKTIAQLIQRLEYVEESLASL